MNLSSVRKLQGHAWVRLIGDWDAHATAWVRVDLISAVETLPTEQGTPRNLPTRVDLANGKSYWSDWAADELIALLEEYSYL